MNTTSVSRQAGAKQTSKMSGAFGLLVAFIVLVASVTLSSCAGYTTNANSGSGSGAGNSGGGVLTSSPSTVAFGNVAVGSSVTQSVSVTNTGTGTVNMSGLSVTGGVYTVVSGNPTASLPVGQSATVQVKFAPTSTTPSNGMLTVTSDASNSSLGIALSGTGMQANASFSPASLSFSNIVVGQTSTQTVTLSNTGNAGLTVSAAAVSGTGFTMGGLSIPASVAPGASTTFSVSFTPTSTTAATGGINFTDNGATTTQSIALAGSAVAANTSLMASPSSFNFGNVSVGANGSQAITLTNQGSSAITVNSVTASGAGFSATGVTAGQSIGAGATATLTAQFAPASGGAASGSITVNSTAPNSSLVISLTGTGLQAQISATPSSVAFGTVATGNTDSQQVTLKNNGNATLTFSQITVAGSGFAQVGLSTSTTIAAGASVNFNATFTPSSASASNGTITLATNGTPSSLVINLSGTGQTATLLLGASPTTLAFGSVLDQTNSSMTSSITNNGNSNVTISGVTTTGAGFSSSGIANGTTLTPGQSATLTVTFAPTQAGAVSGANVTITSNATNSPLVVSLSGSGQHSVLVNWDASTTLGVTYNVFRGTTSGAEGTSPINSAPITTTTYTDTNVTAGQIYYYTVEAVNAAGSSNPSTEASATVPTP